MNINSEMMTGTLMERMGMEVVEASSQRTVVKMPVAGNTQPAGLLHGGATAALAETAGSIAALSHLNGSGAAVGIELNISHHSSIRDGYVLATATPLKLGKTIASYQITVTSVADEKLISSARLSCMLLS